MTGLISVTVNGEPRQVAPVTTVGALVDGLGPVRSGRAVAVNETVLPRSQWDATMIRPGDRVEVLTASQGG